LIKDYICELKYDYDVNINAITGPGYGGLHMIAATLVRLIELDDKEINRISSFVIREKKKDHGMLQTFDGLIKQGDNVLIVDDVVTTGESIQRTIDFCNFHKLNPVAVFTIVNRENVDLQTIKDSVLYTKQLFTLGDFID
jgi:orotate phosphoribosyltransferase